MFIDVVLSTIYDEGDELNEIKVIWHWEKSVESW